MYSCKTCNYFTTNNHNLKNHYKTQKHITLNNLIGSNKVKCQMCNREYTHISSLTRHQKNCNMLVDLKTKHIDVAYKDKYEYEVKKIKQEYDMQLEIEKMKFEHKIIENKMDLIENKTCNITNQTNNTIIHNVNNISKIQFLNLNFGNVLDINTFIENYKTKYGLSNEQALTLLENYQNDGVNGCISSLSYYLKKSAAKQYKEIHGKDIPMENIILPFLLSDKSLREHFEKTDNGKWDKTTMVENIKKIVTITNDQVYNHHNQYMNISGAQRKRIINGLLKSSCYALLTQISAPDLYKSISVQNNENDSGIDADNDNQKIKETKTETLLVSSISKNDNSEQSTKTNNLTVFNTFDFTDDMEDYNEEDLDEEDDDEEDFEGEEDDEGDDDRDK
jgi:hypothetical protein